MKCDSQPNVARGDKDVTDQGITALAQKSDSGSIVDVGAELADEDITALARESDSRSNVGGDGSEVANEGITAWPSMASSRY